MKKSNLKLAFLGIFIILMQNSFATDENGNIIIGKDSKAIGNNNTITGNESLVAGNLNTINGNSNVAIGKSNELTVVKIH